MVATTPDSEVTTIDTQTRAPEIDDEATALAALGAATRDQDDLERDIGQEADTLLTEQADERDNKRLERAQTDKVRLQRQIDQLQDKLLQFGNKSTKDKYRSEIQHYKALLTTINEDIVQISHRITTRHEDKPVEHTRDATSQRQSGESHREFLIRTGKITPFSNVGKSLLRQSSSLAEVMLDAEDDSEEVEIMEPAPAPSDPVSHQNLRRPGFQNHVSAADERAIADAVAEFSAERPAKRRRLQRSARNHHQSVNVANDEAYAPDVGSDIDDEFDSQGEECEMVDPLVDKAGRKSSRKTAAAYGDGQEDLTGIDDGDEEVYQSRLLHWAERRKRAREATEGSAVLTRSEIDDECHQPHPSEEDKELGDGLRLPGDIYASLFDYQKTGVQWLSELYSQRVGGIVGDEMGLGKTIQIISFVAALHYSRKLVNPIIIVTPATVMKQWVNEFHRWWPPLRVSILHSSGSGMLNIGREDRMEADLDQLGYGEARIPLAKGQRAAKGIIDRVTNEGHVLITTYSGLQSYAELLMPTDWQYAVLDEGHKIRNPNTAITIYCKELRTHNRIILSGTPMQNNLAELWSLFDFIFPMRLGTLVDFRQQFEIPIKQGGYANASNLQVETAMKCAETLKDTISPYLLQRFKVDVAADLPKKSERVLFCKLTKLQRSAYEGFLGSEEMTSILDRKRNALYGIDILRKICNHPDLVEHKMLSTKAGYDYGNPAKSGKIQIVKALLEIWKRNGHKTLLFAQHRIMLDILEKVVGTMPGIKFRRMDGNTAVKNRQNLVNEFNQDPDLHVFLLTTKVGGLGVNLTGANRVIIYDPDWNPSTDVQARERAWRLGQKREVEIYRLMTAGTIEEKIYHRQIFKQFLTNKILKDPKQRQTFQLRDLHDLFTLGETEDGNTETGSLFKGTEVTYQEDAKASTTGSKTRSSTSEIAKIKGLARHEEFNAAEHGDEQGDNIDAGDSNKDERMLSSIFAKSGVHSALSHDAIINGRKATIRADPEIIAREARKVAAAAARELDRAGQAARHVPIGTPTWTGTVGVAGRPEARPRRGEPVRRGRGGRVRELGRPGIPSSSSLISNLEDRQAQQSPRGNGHDVALRPVGREFMTLIRDYLVTHGGRVHTQMLIDHFNRYCGTSQRTAEFKEMLKTIAVLEKGSRGRGQWALKDEYKV